MNEIKIGVIPAAGEGKRMDYLSNVLPKCLMPLYDKPIIHYVIDNMVRVGVKKIFIPIFSKKERIIEYFNDVGDNFEVEICLLPLSELPKGLALSIYTTKDLIDDNFITILGDDITITRSLKPLVKQFFSKKALALEGMVYEDDVEAIRRSCSVELNDKKQILRITEKPSSCISNIRGCGVYVFNPKIFEFIEKTPLSEKRNEIEITNTISMIAETRRAYGEFIKGKNINVNTSDDLFRAWKALKNQLKQR